jgi:hypothetical protein
MFMKYSNDVIRNQTHNLRVFSAVPQPTAPPPRCSVFQVLFFDSCSHQMETLFDNKWTLFSGVTFCLHPKTIAFEENLHMHISTNR